MEPEKKKSFLDDIASEKPESFNEEVFLKQKRNYVPLIILTTLAIAVFAILYITFTKGSSVPDMSDWKENEIYAWANSNKATVVKIEEYSLDVDEGILITQELKEGETLKRNGTLKVTISKGPDPGESIPFPDIKSMTLKEIENWVKLNQLPNISIKKENNNVFEKDSVISLDFTDGTQENFIRKNRVKILVSLGVEEVKETISVPDFSTQTKGDIIKWATTNDIKVTFSEDYNDYIEYGKIMAQSIEAKMKMKREDTINITISLGKAIIVPSFVGITRDEAVAVADLKKVQLFFKNEISHKEPGTVLSQDVEAGSTINSQELVTIVIASKSDLVTIPDFMGLTQSEASTLASIHNINTFFVTKASTLKLDQVIEQSNSPGTTVESDTLVTIYISSGDLKVPDFLGLDRSDVEIIVESMELSAIYKEEPSTAYENNSIIEQSIDPETVIEKSAKIIITVATNNGAKVPNFKGMTRSEIDLWGSTNNTTITVIEKYSDIIEVGKYYDQSHIGTYVPGSEPVVIYQSLGRIPVTSFIGLSKLDVQTWQKGVNEQGGQIELAIISDTESTQPTGTIVNQSIVNDFLTIGSTLEIHIATDNINNTIPSFAGMKLEKVEAYCMSNNITYEVKGRYSHEFEEERISGQNYENTQLPSGETLIIYQSLGKLYLPSFVGQGKASIVKWVNEANLDGADIDLNFSYIYSGSNPAEIITNQGKEREHIDVGIQLHVTITTSATVDIPDYKDDNIADVTKELDELNVKYEVIYIYVNEEKAVNVPKGTVMMQSFIGELDYQGHKAIRITVSNGAKTQ